MPLTLHPTTVGVLPYLKITGRPKISDFFEQHGCSELLRESALDLLEAHCVTMGQHMSAPKCLESERPAVCDPMEAVIVYMRGLEARQEAKMADSALQARGEMADRLLTLIGSVDNAVRNALIKVDASTVSERVGEVVREGVGALRAELLLEMRRLERGQADGNTSLCQLKKGSEDVQARMERLHETVVVTQVRQATNQCVKGKVGENRLVDLLGERLTSRDDFQVDLVCGQAHQCDISIKRLGHPEVRIECKAHGEQTGEKVRARETTRFQSDLVGLKLSGIFVSLHASIVGKPDLAIEMLSTGKFAVYLGNNHYDVGVIESMVHLLYRLEGATAVDKGGEHGKAPRGMNISLEAMERVQLMLKSCSERVNATKVHLKSALSILTEMTFDMITRTLLGDDRVATPSTHQDHVLPHVCGQCPQTYKTAGGLATHIKMKHPQTV